MMNRFGRERVVCGVALLALIAVFPGTAAPAAQQSRAVVADAAMRGDAAAVRDLLRDGADANASQGDGMSALHWAAQNGVFDEMALFGAAGLNWTGDGEPEQLLGSRVTESYFRVLGVTPLLGRALRAEDDRFGGQSDVIGDTMRLDDRLYTIVGVMPPRLYPTWPATQGYFAFLPRYNSSGCR